MSRQQPKTPLDRWLPAIAGLITFTLYALTTQRTVGPYDSAELAAGSACLGIVHSPGYPLYLLLGYGFSRIPVGEIAFRVNLMSAFFGALAAGFLAAFLRDLLADRLAAIGAALAFGLCLPVWDRAVVAEVYTLQLAILAASLWLTLRLLDDPSPKKLALLAAVFGLTLAHRPPGLLAGVGIGALLLLYEPTRALLRRPAALIPAILCGLGSLLFYLYLPIRAAADPPLNYATDLQVDMTTLSGVWWMVSGTMFHQLVFAYSLPEYLHELADVLRLIGSAWYGVGALLALIGFAWMIRHQRRWCIGLLLIGLPLALFYAGYRVDDKLEMFLPVLLVAAIFTGAGIRAITGWLKSPATNRLVPAITSLLLMAMVIVNTPQVDRSDDRADRERAEAVLDTVELGALIATEWSTATPLKYLQIIEGQRPDVEIFDWGLFGLGRLAYYRERNLPADAARRFWVRDMADMLNEAMQERPVYAVDEYEVFEEYFTLIPESDVYRVEPRP
ncbi:MAG: DUF2723 domain-containing protein [Anaerolineae bacterium]|nr:DUF2723 domain-containing protein [Anaerolineae bacterium]